MSKARNILIVDDHLDNLRLLIAMLKNENFKVRQAGNGIDALQDVLEFPPDLILLDILMPDINGYEVCQTLKADPATAEIPVIFLSALGDVKEKLAAFKAGGVDYVKKPFRKAELLARVETHIKLKLMQDQLSQQNILLTEEIKERRRLEDQLRKLNNELELKVAYRTKEVVRINEAMMAEAEERGKVEAAIIEQEIQLVRAGSLVAIGEMTSGITQALRQNINNSDEILKLINHTEELISQGVTVPQWIDLLPPVCNSLIFVKGIFHTDKIELIDTLNANLPKVKADPVRIELLIFILLSNARDAVNARAQSEADAYQKQVYLNLYADMENTEVILQVQDNGIGMTAEEQENCLKAFYSTKKSGMDTGLGLNTVNGFVQEFDGYLKIKSNQGEGTTIQANFAG